MKKILTLIFMIMLLCGCSKYEGTWCQKSEVFSTLVILEDNYTTKEYNNILDKVENLNYLRGFDIVDDIEKGNTTINIYFNNKVGMNDSEDILKDLYGVISVEVKSFEVTSQKLVLKDGTYNYGLNLDNVDAKEYKRKYKEKNNVLTLDNFKLYYKDKFLCLDSECTGFLTKSKTDDCN